MASSSYLGVLNSATNEIFNWNLFPDDYFTYYFDVASGDTLYAQFDLYDFDDDLDLELYKKDASSGDWNEIKTSDSLEKEDEFIFKVLGSGASLFIHSSPRAGSTPNRLLRSALLVL